MSRDGLGPRLPELRDEQGPLRPRRAWPADETGSGALVVEAVAADGRVVGAVLRDGEVRLVRRDLRLPLLDAWRTRPGARVIAYRAGKRAVLSVSPHGAGARAGPPAAPEYFVKLARPGAARHAVSTLQAVTARLTGVPGAPRLPSLLGHDDDHGAVTLSALPGRPLRDVITAAARTGDLVLTARAGTAVGQAMSSFAAPLPPAELGRHTLGDELDVLQRWVGDAARHRVVRGQWWRRLSASHQRAAELLAALTPAAGVMTHRDLHDGQVLLDRAAGPASGALMVTFLDLDTAAISDPALDLANLLAHLDLLAATGQARRVPGAVACFRSHLAARLRHAGHPVLGQDPARVDALRAAARVRLAAVHAFRPAAATVVPALLAPPVLPAWCPSGELS